MPMRRAIALLGFLSFPAISHAQADSCAIDFVNNFPPSATSAANATGSIKIPGFQPFIAAPAVQNSTWTVSTTINQVQNFQDNNNFILQDFWLETDPPINTAPADLPYTGCAILLSEFSGPRISTGTNDSNSCDGVFDTSCYNAITGTVNDFLLERSPSGSPFTNIPDICQSLLATPPTQCKKYAWNAVSSTQPFGNPSYPENWNMSCGANIFNGTLSIQSQSSVYTSPVSNFTTYDTFVKQATPLVLLAFTKNITDQTPRWGTSSLVCLTANHVASGSRIPASSGASQSISVWSNYAVLLSAVLGLAIFC